MLPAKVHGIRNVELRRQGLQRRFLRAGPSTTRTTLGWRCPDLGERLDRDVEPLLLLESRDREQERASGGRARATGRPPGRRQLVEPVVDNGQLVGGQADSFDVEAGERSVMPMIRSGTPTAQTLDVAERAEPEGIVVVLGQTIVDAAAVTAP